MLAALNTLHRPICTSMSPLRSLQGSENHHHRAAQVQKMGVNDRQSLGTMTVDLSSTKVHHFEIEAQPCLVQRTLPHLRISRLRSDSRPESWRGTALAIFDERVT
jgi:hypothetical protein